MAYNDKIVIQQYTQARDAMGGVDAGTWAEYKTVWADVEDVSSSESQQSDMPVFSFSKKFKFRTHDAPSVTAKMRISYDSEYWDIQSIRKEGRLHTVIIAEAYDDE